MKILSPASVALVLGAGLALPGCATNGSYAYGDRVYASREECLAAKRAATRRGAVAGAAGGAATGAIAGGNLGESAVAAGIGAAAGAAIGSGSRRC
jgi:hypothetical protein